MEMLTVDNDPNISTGVLLVLYCAINVWRECFINSKY